MVPGHFVVSADRLTVRHHVVIFAVPPESGVAVAEIELLPENVELLVVVHDVVGDEFCVAIVNSEPVTDLPLESVTVTWNM
jgi:hypothetical protein